MFRLLTYSEFEFTLKPRAVAVGVKVRVDLTTEHDDLITETMF